MTTIKTQNQQKREITNSTQLYVNSSNADIYLNGNVYKSSCAFFFEELLKISRNALEMSVTVVNAQIPYSFYIINQYNNHIKIDDVDYYFTYGNYNVNSFLTLWSNTIPGTWTNSFNPTNNKFTFSNNTSFTISDGNSNSILPLLGFITNTTYNSSFIAGLETITSVNVVNFLGPMRLNVKTSSFNIVNNFDTVEKGRTTTLCSVPVNSPAGGMISYFNFTNYKSIFKNHEISTLQLDIVDDVGNLINFNNKDWTMTLQIDIITEILPDIKNLDDIYFEEQNSNDNKK